MATVSHAMRRYPGTPPDNNYTNFSPIRNEDSALGLIGWQSHSDVAPPGSGGALSRSMRYAEPWLYGSVRGTPVLLSSVPHPGHHAHHGHLHTPTLHHFQLCTCSEYVHGTASSRSKKSKGPQLCKKCKGTRLPLGQPGGTVRTKYGTVRNYPTSTPTPTLSSVRAGTVRVTTSASRPTILPPSPTVDPYDLMRRSRLSCSDVGSQFRARSSSPGKNRNYSSTRKSNRPRSPSPATNLIPGRKSILECDVNPYELMSTDSDVKKDAKGKGIGKRLESTDYEEKSQRRKGGLETSEFTTEYEDRNAYEERSSNTPRRKRLESSDYEDSGTPSPKGKGIKRVDSEERSSRKNLEYDDSSKGKLIKRIDTEDKSSRRKPKSADYEDTPKGKTVKRDSDERTSPRRKRAESSDYEDVEVKKTSHIPKLQQVKKKLSKPSDKDVVRNDLKFKSILKKPSATFTDDGGTCIVDGSMTVSGRSGSHFYLPMPTLTPPRKKVQFLVENENNDRKDVVVVLASAVVEPLSTSQIPARVAATIDDCNDEGTDNLVMREIVKSEMQPAQSAEDNEQDLDTEPCRLKRSLSERLYHEITPVSFNDTMALRQPRGRGVITDHARCATLFEAVADLQRLDGVGSRPRPREPPPPPPPPPSTTTPFYNHQEVVPDRPDTPPPRCTTEAASGYDVTMISDQDEIEQIEDRRKEKPTTERKSSLNGQPTPDFIRKTISLEDKTTLKAQATSNVVGQTTLNGQSSTNLNGPSTPDDKITLKAQSSPNFVGKPISNGTPDGIIPNAKPTLKEQSSPDIVGKIEENRRNSSDNEMVSDVPPAAPPRKRSISKQPITNQVLKKEIGKQAERSKIEYNNDEQNGKVIAAKVDDTTKNNQTEEVTLRKKQNMNEEIEDITVTLRTKQLLSEEKHYEDVIFKSSLGQNEEILESQIEETKVTLRMKPNKNHKDYEDVIFKSAPKDLRVILNSAPFEPTITIITPPASPIENISSTRIENSDYRQVKVEPSKTIVQISSPTIQIIPSSVHRLQIKNDFSEHANYNNKIKSDSPQRKTSIMITGDDCYSTVNVNDDVPIYQSSVVVNDYDSSMIEIGSGNRSSSVYITGDFQTTPISSRNGNSDERPKRTLVILDGNNSAPSTPVPTLLNGGYNSESKTNLNGTATPEYTGKATVNGTSTTEMLRKPYDDQFTLDFIEKQTPNGFIPDYIGKMFLNGHYTPNQSILDTGKTCVRLQPEGKEDNDKLEQIPEKPSSEELLRLLKDPVEAVKRNLVPHVCGKADAERKSKSTNPKKQITSNSLVARLLEDPFLGSLAEGLETNTVAKLIEDSLLKLRSQDLLEEDKDVCSENECPPYELMEAGSDCYSNHSNRSSVTEDELGQRSKFYQLLADSALSEVEDHHYESIRPNVDPIYEEIEIPPPLPANPPPSSIVDDLQIDKQFTTRSIFEGASKYDILSYLVDAKERGIIPEESYTYNFTNSGDVIVEEEEESNKTPFSSRVSHISTVSDSSEDSSLVITSEKNGSQKSAEVERNDSGVGSETSKCSRSRYLSQPEPSTACEDCELAVEPLPEDGPLICRKCSKKRSERKEIITEIVETEEKYSRDLQIILEEFYQPMLVAGLLTPDQLSAIFLNVEELLENSQALAERLRDTLEIALEQGDEDLQQVNIGKIFLEAAPMLHAFESYCVRQGPASLLLAGLEKDKELLRIFLRVSQMENTVLRRMNLNSFLMVPVQRVTKYPLLLARLHKVTPLQHESRDLLRESQHKIELHLSHMNSETKDVPSKLWRRISSGSGRRSSSEMDLVNIKLRKIAVDVLEWNHDEARFALEGRLLFTQPTDNNWRKGRTIKLTPINALLVTNGKPNNPQAKPDRNASVEDNAITFPRHTGVREAALLLVRDKGGRYSLLREPLYLDRCVIATDPAWQSYFEVQELLGKDTFIFKAEDAEMTRTWYRQLQYHAQGMGAWRKRRNALANIMINGMGSRS